MQNVSLMEIKRSDVAAHEPGATEMMRSARGGTRQAAPERAVSSVSGNVSAVSSRPTFDPTAPRRPAAAVQGVTGSPESLIAAVNAVTKDDPLPTEGETHVLRTVRTGIATARAVVSLFETTTELAALKRQLNEGGRLTAEATTRMAELQGGAAIIAGFVACSYIAWALADFMADSAVPVEVPEPAEFRLDNPLTALEGVVWELSVVVGAAKDDPTLARIVREHCGGKAAAFALRAMGVGNLDRFTGSQYKVEGTEFTVKGFEVPGKTRSDALVMEFRKPEEVVGNHLAKSASLRLAKMMMCYDFPAQTSPFVTLGGHVFTFMGDGFPGTGKTTLIQMICGLLNDYCKVAGYPFRYQNFGVDEVSEFQGMSGRNCRAFLNRILDPRAIGFGTIDDIDQVAGKRGDRQSSGGQQEITAVLMDAFAGANTVVRGNCTFGMFSNYPENVDDALRQRAGARFLIDGPKTQEDYQDLLAILLRKQLGGIGLGAAEGKLFATQSIKEAVRATLEKHSRPMEEKIADIFDATVSRLGPLDDLHKLSVYLKAISDVEPRFTGRAVKNIADAVKTRAMDFDIPDEWFENPEVFLHRPIGSKTDMLRELMIPVTSEMVLQEINIYADSEARYGDKSFEAAVSAVVRDQDVRAAALAVLEKRNGAIQ